MRQIRFRNFALSSVAYALLHVLTLTVFGGVSTPVLAQSATGQILGTVTDSTGAVIPNATVTITNTATNQSSTVKHERFRFLHRSPQLIPGPYKIKVEAPGFTISVVKVEALEVNQALNQIVALKTGSATETVEVTSSGEVMQTASSEVGVVVDPEQVHDIPLNGRNFTTLITLAPGAGPVSTAQSSYVGFGPISSVGIPGSSLAQQALQGQWNRMNFYTLDGAINSAAISSSYVVLPMIDSIQEFKVQSHSDNAEFGGVLGGVVNVTTKPGGNAFHGSSWEYIRNTAFDANVAYTGVNGLHQNQFGGLLDGPVRIPWLYNGKDRSFFTFGYEGWRYKSNLGAHYDTVPTDAELSGDFSNSLLTQNGRYNHRAECGLRSHAGATHSISREHDSDGENRYDRSEIHTDVFRSSQF